MTRPVVKSLEVPTVMGLTLLSLALCPFGLRAQQRPSTPACEVRLDLQYKLQKTAHVTLAGHVEVPPSAVKVIMGAAGEDHWNEVTKHGKKYPGICRDDEHPYYVLVWEVTDYDATASLYVLDDGCLVYPAVYGSVSISNNREKAIKKVFADNLRFLVQNGKQPAPTPLYCIQPKELGPFVLTKYKIKTEREICNEHRPAYTKACGSWTENATASPETPNQPASNEGRIVVGTAFFVSEHGYILTNAHVVSGCKQIQTRDGRSATLVSTNEQIDLALLKTEGESPAVATFRTRPPRLGDSIIAFGYPLQGLLSSEGNLSTGTISATAGMGDDTRFLQISAPIQPGNSGSPLLDSSGNVVGVVEAKLDAVASLRVTGDIPQNVNFAIRGSEVIQFLERSRIPYHGEATNSNLDLKVADIAAKAKQFSVPIECLQ